MAGNETEQELKNVLVALKDAYRQLERIAIYEDLYDRAQFSLTEAAGSTFSAFASLREAIEQQSLQESSGHTRSGGRR